MQHISFLKAEKIYEKNAIVQEYMANTLLDILKDYTLSFDNIFEFGCGFGKFSKKLIANLEFKSLDCVDVNDYKLDFLAENVKFSKLDMNELQNSAFIHQKFDLLTSNACLQWLDFKKSFEAFKKMMRDKSLLLVSTFSEGNLIQIKQSTGFTLDYLSLEQMKNILCKDFEPLYLADESYELKFDSALSVFKHLKLSGVNSLGRFFLSKAFLKDFESKFANTITYRPCFILCKKRIN